MTKKDNYGKVIKILQELHKKFPSFGMGRHLSTALADYGDLWNISDKEILFALEKYVGELEYITPDEDLEKIIKDGENLFEEIDPLDKEDFYE